MGVEGILGELIESTLKSAIPAVIGGGASTLYSKRVRRIKEEISSPGYKIRQQIYAAQQECRNWIGGNSDVARYKIHR
jgi:hypothetical protein